MAGIIGIFGGTFDPPHTGHLALAAEAQFQLGLDRVLWVLTPDPPHKRRRRITPLETRLELLQAALGDNPQFELSRVDIDRPPPHFAVDTVRLLRQKNSEAKLVYLMGGDSLHDLPTWYQPQAFLENIDQLGVMRRPSDRVDLCMLEDRLPGLLAKVKILDTPLLEISATEIRRRAAHGEPFRYYLPAQVYELIIKRQMYQK
jgi:nicotinate-nucleotide adenylyltransferase